MKTSTITTIIISACIFALCFIGQLKADILQVPSNDYPSISAALNDAFAGDKIIVAAGTYQENIEVTAGVELTGAGEGESVIAASSGDVVKIEATTPSSIKGFTIDGKGGARYAIYPRSETTISDITITGAAEGIYSYNSSPIIDNVTIADARNNGIYCSNGTPTISNTTIANVGKYGVYCTFDGSPSITNVTITNIEQYGIYCSSGSPSISNTTIEHAQKSGIFIGSGSPKVRQCIIARNDENGVLINGGTPDLGTTEEPGNNEIFRNREYNLQTKVNVTAIENWWGSDPPNENLFSGNVVYKPWLTEPPISSLPTIEEVNPNSGSTEGGTLITITGSRFVEGAKVMVGEKEATSVSVESETQITAVAPTGPEGTADVVVINPDGKQVSLAEGFSYTSSGDGEQPTHTGIYQVELSLTTGVNIISLPLRPDNTYNASTLAQELAATVILRAYEGAFQVYVPEGEYGLNFPIEMGKGYIVNVLKETPFSLTGRAWGTEVLASPSISTSETWAFVVAGSVPPHSKVLVANKRTGQIAVAHIDASGEFTAAFVDMNKRGVVAAGDEISLRVYDNFGNTVGREQHYRIKPENLDRAYILANIEAAPTKTRLLQNYPNPFNPETWIPFHLSEDADVTIAVCDIKGNPVRKLSLGTRQAGIYTTRTQAAYWDGRNNLGESVSTGIYFYTLKAGDFCMTLRMVVVK